VTRSATLPTGVSTEVTSAQYRAVHAVEIGYSSALRITDGPESVTVLGNAYSPWLLEIGSVSIGKTQGLSIRVGNADQSVSTKEIAATAIGATVKVYEVVWSAAGSQLDPVQVFSGIVSGILWDEQTVEYDAKLLPASSAGFVGVRATKLCSHVFKSLRCGYGDVAAPTFTRATTGFNQSGTSSASGDGRYDYCHADQGLCIEEACSNLLTANQGSVETDTTGFTLTGSTISRSNEQAWTGTYSLKVVTANSVAGEGVYTANTTTTVSVAHSAGVWVRGSGTVKIGLDERTSGDVEVGITYGSNVALSSTWQWLTVSRTFGGTGARARVYVVTTSQQSATFYCDGFQLEQKAYSTSWQTGAATRNAETLTVPSGAFTNAAGALSLWVKLLRPYGTQNQYVFHNGGSTNAKLEVYVNTSGKVVCVYGTGATTKTITSSGSALSAGTNYHLCVVWSASGVTLYQAGSSVGTDATAPGLTASTMYLGSDSAGANQLGGWIDEVVFFSTALTSTEVAALAAMKGAQKLDTTTTYYVPLDGHARRAEGPSATTCDHTYATCTAKSNTARWGGLARICPAIGQVVRYTVVGQQGTQQKVGTTSNEPDPYVPTTPTSGGIRGRIYSTP
jgi:hypothetical protein